MRVNFLRRSPILPFSALSSLFALSYIWNPMDSLLSSTSLSHPSLDSIPVLNAFSSLRRGDSEELEQEDQIILDGMRVSSTSSSSTTNWRARLEEDVEHGIGKSRTLGFDKIVTLSLAGNEGTRGLHSEYEKTGEKRGGGGKRLSSS